MPNEPLPRPTGHRQRSSFIERTLADVGHALEQSLFAEELSRQPGLLQSLDPRVKVLSIVLLLLSVSLSRNLWILAGLYLVALVLAYLSRLPMGTFVRRVWLLLPFFTGMIALPAFFLTPGPALVQLPWGLTITRTGAQTALFLLLRVSTSMSFGVLLILTTAWNSVLKALNVLKVPDVFILTLGMTYRYIYLLLHTTNDMFLSRKSRVIGHMNGQEERRLLAASAGALLGKSLHLSEEVYLAMQSRGFRGHPRTLDHFKMKAPDWVFATAVVMVSAAAIWFGRA
jgi:cobalt/nickel transport system permease protein